MKAKKIIGKIIWEIWTFSLCKMWGYVKMFFKWLIS